MKLFILLLSPATASASHLNIRLDTLFLNSFSLYSSVKSARNKDSQLLFER